ncbi:MAG: AarF/ABC1/UbiB kinase family protein [Myxococcales bacterium]|nr:AarF/ABC1/UbiB kinase family protein [Myxococcales bacterium]
MLRSAAQELARLRKITAVIGKYGYEELIRRSPDLPQDTDSSDLEDGGHSANAARAHAAPRRFRLMLEELGPTFIKLGQVLSSRPDLVSRDYVEELKNLQDDCEPLPFEQIRAAIESGLGRPLDQLFERVEETPIATASIAQVHRGTTLEGDAVVIKVQRPGILEQVRRDVDLLYRVARILDAVIEESQLAEPVGVVREFDKALTEELNFQHEAANIQEFGALHAERPDVVIPRTFPSLCSASVLTMSYLEGVPFSRLPDDVDKKLLARRIVQEAFDEVFLDGVFHADPHPGNLMYLGPGRYGILDLGLLGRLSKQMQETIVVLALAVAVRDADTVARTLYRLGQHDQRVSLSDVRQDTIDLFNRYLNRSIKDVDSTTLVQEILTLGMKHRLRIPPEYTMLGRAGATIEGIVRELDPDIDVADVAKPYAERLLMDRVAPDNMQGGMYKALLQLQGMSEELPLQVSQILSDLSSGKLNVTVSGRDLERLTNTVLMSATTIAGAILGGAFVVGSFIGMAQLDWAIGGVPIVGIFGALVGATVMTWVGAYILLRPRLKKISLLRLLTKRR